MKKMNIQAYDITGKKTELWDVDLSAVQTGSSALLAQALRVYESNAHQKTHKVLTRGEVDGSTRKIYRQKGTGNARHGAKYAPIFVGGGIAHGPSGVRPANMVLPKRMRRRALLAALADKLNESAVSGIEGVQKVDGKTASAAHLLSTVANHPKAKVLVVTAASATKLYQMMANLQGVTMKRASLVNAYDLVSASHVMITKKALDSIVARATTKVRN
jgi:large subunit ribosomal protein L4